jgi:hypothetical protein
MVAAATTVAMLLVVPGFETIIRRGGPPGGGRYSVTPAADLVLAFSRWFREFGWVAIWTLPIALALRRRSSSVQCGSPADVRCPWQVIALGLCLSVAISALILFLVTLVLTIVLVPIY